MTAVSQVPVLRVAEGGALADVLSHDALASIASDALLRFLGGRRWFGAKGAAPRSARITAVVPLREGDLEAAITRVDVELGDGRVERYQLPVIVRRVSEPHHDEARGVERGDVIARLEAGSVAGELVDAAQDARFRRFLFASIVAGRAVDGHGARWIAQHIGQPLDSEFVIPASRVSSAEQSNTSIVYGDQAILKLFRRLEPGENPDVEVSRFLTARAHFPHTPALLGTLHLETREGTSVAGMMQRFLPGASDAWSYALMRGSEDLREGVGDYGFERDAAQLGRVTRSMHEALASGADDPDFAPSAATREDIARWASAARSSIERGLALLASRLQANALPERDVGLARSVLDARETIGATVDDIERRIAADAGMMIRHHGDYHLGQVLRARDGRLFVIDFEGEPARPLEERRARNSALRDVAGMLRSFAYAAATLASEPGAAEKALRPTPTSRVEDWEQRVGAAFLSAYFGADDEPEASALPPFLPSTPERALPLLALFELEKLFYELAYELNNRPDWAWIPLRGTTAYASGDAFGTHNRERSIG